MCKKFKSMLRDFMRLSKKVSKTFATNDFMLNSNTFNNQLTKKILNAMAKKAKKAAKKKAAKKKKKQVRPIFLQREAIQDHFPFCFIALLIRIVSSPSL